MSNKYNDRLSEEFSVRFEKSDDEKVTERGYCVILVLVAGACLAGVGLGIWIVNILF